MSSIETSSSRIRSCSDGEQETERPERMRDWLIRMINSNRFPGLEWLDQDKTIFKVPWIHAKKRGYNRERDAALFKEWALHSGKFRDESDPTVWKINFRCAINGLKDIIEMKDYQTEDCRVYKVLPRTRPPKRRRRSIRSGEPYTYPAATAAATAIMNGPSIPAAAWPTSCIYPTSLSSDQTYSQTSSTCHYQPNVRVPLGYPSVTSCLPTCTSSGLPSARSYSSYYNQPTPPYSTASVAAMDARPPNKTIVSSPLGAGRGESPDSGYGGCVEPAIPVVNSPIVNSPAQMCSSPEVQAMSSSPLCAPEVSMTDPLPSCAKSVITSSGPACSESGIADILVDLAETSNNPSSPALSPSPPHKLNVTVYYGSINVMSKDIMCDKGCRIYCGPNFTPPSTTEQANQLEKIFGPLEAEQIALPNGHPLPQANEVFESMKRGLLIEMHDNDVYATPLCNNIVFCGTSYYHQSQPLEKEKRTKVFDYNNFFQPSLEQYSLHRGPPPDSHVIFSLGQAWGPQQPITHNCVFIVVSHTQAKHDLEVYSPPFSFAYDLFCSVPDIVDTQQANATDLRAESYLNTVFNC